jgi:hypothetical protein
MAETSALAQRRRHRAHPGDIVFGKHPEDTDGRVLVADLETSGHRHEGGDLRHGHNDGGIESGWGDIGLGKPHWQDTDG